MQRLLLQEAAGLLSRLDLVRPFALHETMVVAAALTPSAQRAIESFLVRGRRHLRREIVAYLGWLRGPGRLARPDEMQRRYALLRLRFNTVLTQLDLFADVITQRSEHTTGVWLAGLDAFADDALTIPTVGVDHPPVVCYLDRGPGAAIRRARTRLPGGGPNPVAIVRVPRERMVGSGIASSLVHEVGHQAAALLNLVPAIQPALAARAEAGTPRERLVWSLWARWLSEILADLWSVSRVGVGATLGLIGVVSLPRWAVYRVSAAGPHPAPWIRVKISCALGEALYPHPQWPRLAAHWEQLYPRRLADPRTARVLGDQEATLAAFVQLLLGQRPPALRGRSVGELTHLVSREPASLLARFGGWQHQPASLWSTPPTLAFAVLGQAKAAGRLSTQRESHLVGRLLTRWALERTLRPTGSRPGRPGASNDRGEPAMSASGPDVATSGGDPAVGGARTTLRLR